MGKDNESKLSVSEIELGVIAILLSVIVYKEYINQE
jgi:hypothetical protein